MKVLDGIVVKFGEIVEQAKKDTLADQTDGAVQDEPSITGRFLATLQNEINRHGQDNLGTGGIRITGSVLTDRGFSSAESRFGADLGVVLDIDIDGFTLKKGFICQAKNEGHGITIHTEQFRTSVSFSNNQYFTRLKDQTEDMLRITPDSFVIVYGRNDFVMVPAISINGLNDDGELYGKPVSKFFKEFLMCFIGDRDLTRNPEDWERIRVSAKKVFSVAITKA